MVCALAALARTLIKKAAERRDRLTKRNVFQQFQCSAQCENDSFCACTKCSERIFVSKRKAAKDFLKKSWATLRQGRASEERGWGVLDKGEKELMRKESDDMFDIGSTLSGNSMVLKPNHTSVFKKTQYLDQVEDILMKRKKQRKQKALQFLKQMELKKSEAMAQQLLASQMQPKQSQRGVEEQISTTRKQMMEGSTVQKLMRRASSLSSLSSESENLKSDVIRGVNAKKDPLFFEFFSIYTAQSVKQNK